MFDVFYKSRLKQDLEVWVGQGWVSPDGAAQILKSQEEQDGGSKLPMAIASIGVLCLALALAAFIAANWGAIPKTLKLTSIAVGILLSNAVAAWASSRGREMVSDLATGFATLVFVGGLSLVGQIFHLPTDWAGGALLITFGALAAAWATASRSSLLIAIVAAATWNIYRGDLSSSLATLFSFVLLAAMLLHVTRYPNRLNRAAAIALLLITYGSWASQYTWQGHFTLNTPEVIFGFASLAMVMLQTGPLAELVVKWSGYYPQKTLGRWLLLRNLQDVGMAMLVIALVLIQTFIGTPSQSLALADFGLPVIFIPMILATLSCIVGLVLSFQTRKSLLLFATAALLYLAITVPLIVTVPVLSAALALTAAIAVSLLGTLYRNTQWTLSGYAGVTCILLWLLHETVGSLLGQAAFFLIAGLLLLIMALASARHFRKRRATTTAEKGAAA